MSVRKLHTEFNTFYYFTFTCFRWISLKKQKSMEELSKIMKKQIEEKQKEEKQPKVVPEKFWNDPIKVFKNMFGL